MVWARVISRAASDSDFAAVLRDNLAEAFAVFGVSGLGDIDPEQDLIPSYSAALEMIGAAAHPPAAASGLMPGQAKPNPVGDDITTASSGCACAATAQGSVASGFTSGCWWMPVPEPQQPTPAEPDASAGTAEQSVDTTASAGSMGMTAAYSFATTQSLATKGMNMQSSGTSSTLGGDCVGSFGSAGSIGSVGGTAGSFATAGTYGCAGAQALCESTPMTQASIKPTVASIRQCELTQASIRQCDFTVASIKPCNFTTATQLTQSCLSTPVPTLATQVTTGSMLTNPGPISSTRLSGGDYTGQMSGDCWGSAGSFGSAGTFGGCAGSVGTAGTYGSGGSNELKMKTPDFCLTPTMGSVMTQGTQATLRQNQVPTMNAPVSGDCVGSVGSAGSIGSVGGTAGTFATAGTYGCAGGARSDESDAATTGDALPDDGNTGIGHDGDIQRSDALFYPPVGRHAGQLCNLLWLRRG